MEVLFNVYRSSKSLGNSDGHKTGFEANLVDACFASRCWTFISGLNLHFQGSTSARLKPNIILDHLIIIKEKGCSKQKPFHKRAIA